MRSTETLRSQGRWMAMARAGVGLFGASWLAGCVTAPAAGDATLRTGRLALHIEATATQPVQGLSAAFELQGDGSRGTLRLLSPLGPALAVAHWSPGMAELTSAGVTTRFSDLGALAQHALGEPVPLQALPDWLRARAWDGAPHSASVAPQPAGFAQLGWQVQTAGAGQGRITAQRSAPPVVTLRVLLDAVVPPAPAAAH